MSRTTKGMLSLLAAVVVGMACFGAARWANRSGSPLSGPRVLTAMPELEWLRGELKLSAEQYENVRARHEAYLPVCADLCRRIEEARRATEAYALTHQSLTPEYDDRLNRHARAHVDCQREMLKHLYETAGLLREDQARRYLEMMLPYALHFKHRE